MQNSKNYKQSGSKRYGKPKAPKSKVELIVARGHKLDGTGAIVVTIDPQWADLMQDIFEELRRIVGHENIAIFPVPEGSIKFYSVKTNPEMINIQVDVNQLKPELGGLDGRS